jgi:hypothetical protein
MDRCPILVTNFITKGQESDLKIYQEADSRFRLRTISASILSTFYLGLLEAKNAWDGIGSSIRMTSYTINRWINGYKGVYDNTDESILTWASFMQEENYKSIIIN